MEILNTEVMWPEALALLEKWLFIFFMVIFSQTVYYIYIYIEVNNKRIRQNGEELKTKVIQRKEFIIK